MQKDDGNPSGGERRPESGERSADSGKREAQARRPRRGTRRTDGPLGKRESKNTKKMIAAQAIDPAKDIAASKERIAREDERAKRVADARVDAAAGAGTGTGAAGAGAAGGTGTKAVVAVDHETALAKSEAAYGVRQNAATYDDVREAKAARSAKHGTSRPDARRRGGTARADGGAERTDARAARSGRDGEGREERLSAGERVAAARERAASGAQTARERATSAREWAAAHRRLWIVLAVVVAVLAAVYGPAQRYYVSVRTTQDLQVKYAALKSQNKDLQSDVDTLMSKEGIEDQARKNGYVYPGEKGVEVKGLKEDGKDPSAAITYKDDRAWYTKVLDVLFGYDRKTVLK
ncbi:septum formation initiator family protein [Parafannyhessea umbonata]|uniref:septum formation initiator family protein n=1 Tax=Parafannyhessea umbonata TaxID=604330 RepID=UPI0026F0F4F6|nr:septum formation initiator family protein [Parafannyhessea umbonata]MDD7199695.1 septum formation initiator family protein [Parafannyhessea umbonata]